ASCAAPPPTGPSRARPAASFDELRSRELRRIRDDARRVEVEPLLEERRVHAAEVRRRLQVAVLVQARREPGKLADLRTGGTRAEEEAGPGRAVAGAARAVLLGAPAELRPDEREHAVGDAARLEVALERIERRGGCRQRGCERRCLTRVCV